MKSWWPNGLVFEAKERFEYEMKGKERKRWCGTEESTIKGIISNQRKTPKKISKENLDFIMAKMHCIKKRIHMELRQFSKNKIGNGIRTIP